MISEKTNEVIETEELHGTAGAEEAFGTAETGRRKGNPAARAVLWFLTFPVPVALGLFLSLGYRWVFSVWEELDVNEVIYQLNAPLEGTGNGMLEEYYLTGIVPMAVITAAACALVLVLGRKPENRKKAWYKAIRIGAPVAGILLFAGAFYGFWVRLDMGGYIEEQRNKSTFIEEHYADPAKVAITFPEKKRNLIFIYLESVESTYADKESGGAFERNVIPELTELAVGNEDFSGSDDALNGGRVVRSNHFTMGGIFGISSGLPLKVDVAGLSRKFIRDNDLFDGNDMATQEQFYDSTVMIGDILQREGYRQIFLLGSDASFGGRRLFYNKHGDFEIMDYPYAQEAGWIAPDYNVFWGYEDEKLFEFARNLLTELAAGDEPFNLTMLTVDSHFEDGYICRLCGNEFPGNQYANVMACSSRQVAEFVRWCQGQDFYDNTTIILTGDHTTMDTDFCAEVPKKYVRRTYTAFINADASPADPARRRDFCTQDLFPTTVAALGAKIEGDRLGLGTDLFSDTDTLTEEMGFKALLKEQNARSTFMEKMANIDIYAPERGQ